MPALLNRKKKWGVTMRQLPNVLVAMQSIQANSVALAEALQVLLEGEPLSSGGKKLLGVCTGINNSIWEAAHDYEATLPTWAKKIGPG